jgi:copper chaperone NosL
MKFLVILSLFLVGFAACSVKPDPIDYGEDNCVHCEMTIMDHRYGTEVVSDKGKVYKFDSIECLVEFLEDQEKGEEKFSLVLFTPFDQPGKLFDAFTSHVLHSRNLPSPMGMYLTAFETKEAATGFQGKYGGKLYDWEALNRNYKIIKVNGPSE